MKPIRLAKDLLILTGWGRSLGMLAEGEMAPDFSARTHEGDDLRLSDLRGNTVVLWFYPKAGTGG